MTEPTQQQQQQMVDALLFLQQLVAALGVQLADKRTRGAGVERVAGTVGQWMQQNRPRLLSR